MALVVYCVCVSVCECVSVYYICKVAFIVTVACTLYLCRTCTAGWDLLRLRSSKQIVRGSYFLLLCELGQRMKEKCMGGGSDCCVLG